MLVRGVCHIRVGATSKGLCRPGTTPLLNVVNKLKPSVDQ